PTCDSQSVLGHLTRVYTERRASCSLPSGSVKNSSKTWRRGRGRRSGKDVAGGPHRRDAPSERGDTCATGPHGGRALLASLGALGSPTREDRPASNRPYVAGVSAWMSALPAVPG